MTEPPTEEELGRIEAAHHQEAGTNRCTYCLEPWPCPTHRLVNTYLYPDESGLIPVQDQGTLLSDALVLLKRWQTRYALWKKGAAYGVAWQTAGKTDAFLATVAAEKKRPK